MTIKGIFFDAADVLYARKEPAVKYAERLLRELGYPGVMAPADAERRKALSSQAKGGHISAESYWDELLKMYGVVAANERAALSEKIVAQSDTVYGLPDVREALQALKARGFTLSIITDTIHPMARKMRWLEQVGVAELVDYVACSTELGAHKPDPAIYLAALRQVGLTAEEAAFVGHDTAELAGARAVGMKTVAVFYDADAQADYYAESLAGLLNVPIFKNVTHEIEAIFLDVGNTLRIVLDDPPFRAQARTDLMALVGAQEAEEVFFARLEARWNAYRKASKQSLVEASERELWTVHLLPDYPAEQIGPLAGRLTRLWRDHDGRRVPRPDVKATIIELHHRGYRLGIIANTITETEIPDWMAADGVTEYFDAVVLSSKVGMRKPDPRIYWEAAQRIGVEPARCAYVGDNMVRDVEGTRAAGFGVMIILYEPATVAKEPPTVEHKPDFIIRACSELLAIFPGRSHGA